MLQQLFYILFGLGTMVWLGLGLHWVELRKTEEDGWRGGNIIWLDHPICGCCYSIKQKNIKEGPFCHRFCLRKCIRLEYILMDWSDEKDEWYSNWVSAKFALNVKMQYQYRKAHRKFHYIYIFINSLLYRTFLKQLCSGQQTVN